jgi:hypothetical protein
MDSIYIEEHHPLLLKLTVCLSPLPLEFLFLSVSLEKNHDLFTIKEKHPLNYI